MYVSVICAYAPTTKASRGIKQKFYSEVQDTVAKVPDFDMLMMLGDFNVHVGTLDPTSDEWQRALGRNGKSKKKHSGSWAATILCFQRTLYHDHMVPEERDIPGHQDTSCNQAM